VFDTNLWIFAGSGHGADARARERPAKDSFMMAAALMVVALSICAIAASGVIDLHAMDSTPMNATNWDQA